MKINELHEVFEAMMANDSDWFNAAEESMRFYTGGFGTGQWEDEDLQTLQSEGRPPLQLNIILPKVNLVTGVERQGRSSWKARPVESDDENEAMLATSLLYHLDRNRKLQSLFSRVFKDGVITGRGWVDVCVEPGRFYDGEISIKRESWANVHIDPEAKTQDTKDWNYLARTKYLTLNQLRSMFPDSAKDITSVESLIEMPQSVQKEIGSYYRNADPINAAYHLDELHQKVRVVEMWNRDYEREHFIINKQTARISPTGFKSKSKAVVQVKELVAMEEAANAPMRTEFGVISRVVPKTYLTITAGMHILQEKQANPYLHNQFPIVPYFYHFEDMGDYVESFGLVENMKDPQREKDKRRSQMLDIINRSPRGGGVFSGNKVSQEEMNEASTTGRWIGIPGYKGRVSDFMQQWSNSHLSLIGSISAMEQKAEYDAKEISGATDPMMGIATSTKESGVAAQTRIRQGMMTLQEQMENLDMTKTHVLTQAIQNMQQFYTPNKIKRIIGAETEKAESPEEAMEIEAVINRFLTNFEKFEFDIVLDKGENSATMRAAKAQQIGELVRNGYASLFPLYVELSDMEASQEILEKFEQERSAQMQAQQSQAGNRTNNNNPQ
tara:strand:- start:12296 stop:14131 length:1836 start_codon:yes stop_codon:yes gene_type:complete